MWFQKSRISWSLEGDCCSIFFFVSTLVCRKRNRVDNIKLDDGSWLNNRLGIRDDFLEIFRSIFCEDFLPANVDLSGLVSSLYFGGIRSFLGENFGLGRNL